MLPIRILMSLIAVCVFVMPYAAQAEANAIEAANGATFALSGTNKTRNADQLIRYTPDYYRKNAPSAAGVDVYVADGKIVEIRDRAKVVYLDKKSDPGAIKTNGEGYVLSGNGAARKWIVENLKTGEAIKSIVASGSSTAAATTNAEVPPAKSAPCFSGAYYRKVASSFDVWTGIVGTVKLPMPQVDEDRLHATDKQPLDNFSIYLGGRAGEQEIDAGLNWEFTVDEKGERSQRRNAFRPFWRNEKWNAAPAQKEFYWQPGDTVTIGVLVAAPGRLRLIVADAVPVAGRAQRVFQTEFDAKGFAPRVPRQFKRVNAIDQRGNEGKPVQATRAQVPDAVWSETFLLRGEGANAQRLSLTPARTTDMRCPDADKINVTATDTERARGGETISIYGTPKN